MAQGRRNALDIPLALSYDTRDVLANTAMLAGKDQRRLNCHYEITRTSVDARPDVALARRPGVTIDASTYGADGQVQYLVGRDPASVWNPTAWVFVKNSTNNNVVSSATSTTILDDTNYYPRFWEMTNISGTNNVVVQLQNSASPSGTPAQKVYYSTAIATWTNISDAVFVALSHRGKMEHMDGYAFIADSRHRIYQSAINSLVTWADTDYVTKSATLDATQGLIKGRGHILLFGTDTVEAFRNEGNASGSVLSRVKNTEYRIGLSAVAGGGASMVGKTSYYCQIGDLIFFVGRYGGSQFDSSLIAYDGNRYEKVSRPYEDTLLSTATVYSVNRVSFGGKVAVAMQMTLPTAATQRMLLFFPDINEWFEWDSTVWGPVNNGYQYSGVADEQKLYTFAASNNWQDAGTSFDMIVQFRLPSAGLDWKTMNMCGLIADTTTAAENISIQFSNDDGQNYTTARTVDLNNADKTLHRCGTYRERMVRLTHSGSKEVRLRRFFASVI